MTSMRKLNRRLHRWRRYAARTYWNQRVTSPRWLRPGSAVLCAPGHTRAWDAVQHEQERRFWDETPEIWLGGPAGEAALIADVLDDEPQCNVDSAPGEVCYCTRREGCPFDGGDDLDDEPDDDAGHGDTWRPIETVDNADLIEVLGLVDDPGPLVIDGRQACPRCHKPLPDPISNGGHKPCRRAACVAAAAEEGGAR